MSKVDGNRKKTGGRAKGTPNKTTALLKDAILQAAMEAGATEQYPEGSLVQYLKQQAKDSPGPFLALLGKVLPMQLTGADGAPLEAVFKTVYESAPR